MSTKDVIYEGEKNITDFIRELKIIVFDIDRFDKSTKQDNSHSKKIKVICNNLKCINAVMSERVKIQDRVNLTDVEPVIKRIDKTNTQLILNILRIVFKKRKKELFDDQVKRDVFKACQAYVQLVGEFRGYLPQVKIERRNRPRPDRYSTSSRRGNRKSFVKHLRK